MNIKEHLTHTSFYQTHSSSHTLILLHSGGLGTWEAIFLNVLLGTSIKINSAIYENIFLYSELRTKHPILYVLVRVTSLRKTKYIMSWGKKKMLFYLLCELKK